MITRREFLKDLIITSAGIAVLPQLVLSQTTTDPWKTEYRKILARIRPPKFPNRNFPITKFGAKPGTDSTIAITKAIDACSRAGGGRVVVPAGEFLTGAIHLKSNVNLHVSKGATLRFSTDPNAYLPIVHTRWEG